ncbi:NUDIX hydrolase [Niabella yanshanensis]|uniref:GDP-mannose pyrophosphatase n=1 Tax=Niabella yanshanensis TaxID=577386 RepID=A0ABZ0WBS8_9BACT|nr:NUDIX hydrolase [Niabella yanshanensis]WQD40004.1 NUDIX hydrolase [Niabella yanshanensis]
MSEIENPWKVTGKKEVYSNPWISLTEFDVVNPGGGKGIYGKVHFKNAAIGVIALDEDLNTYLVGQYRFVLDAYSWEIPEGGCPEDQETYLEAAQRELLEEAGLTADNWTELLRFHLSNSVCDEHGIIFLARKLKQGLASPEETEQDMRSKKVPFSEAVAMVNDGRITDSISIMAIQKVQLMILLKEI